MEYIIRQVTFKAGEWTRFAQGERIVAVIGSHRATGETVYVTALVERLPGYEDAYVDNRKFPPAMSSADIRGLVPEAA